MITDRCLDQLKLPFALWTREAVAELIEQRWNRRLSMWTVGRLLKRWGFTPQKPARQAYERDPQAVRKWLQEDYPAIAREAKQVGAETHWGDEMGLRSDHQTGTTWSRRGRTPVVPVRVLPAGGYIRSAPSATMPGTSKETGMVGRREKPSRKPSGSTGPKRAPADPAAALAEADRLVRMAADVDSIEEVAVLALSALGLSPDCAAAYLLLGNCTDSAEDAVDLFRRGVAAADRVLGAERFRAAFGRFGADPATRMCLEARYETASCLEEIGRTDEAVAVWQEMLRLAPRDEMRARYRLALAVVDESRADALGALLAAYPDDEDCTLAWARVLHAFRREGESERTAVLLHRAMTANPHVAAYLLGALFPSPEPPEYVVPGTVEEAEAYAVSVLPAWKNTAGAVSWLRRSVDPTILPKPDVPRVRRPAWKKLRERLLRSELQPDTVWEVDALPSTETIRGEPGTTWTLLVADGSRGVPLDFHVSDACPAPNEVLDRLVELMLSTTSEGDEPQRPGALHVRRKAWAKAWQKKFAEIEVDCRVVEHLECVDALFEPMRQAGSDLAGDDADDGGDPSELPQHVGERWQVAVRRLPAWINLAGRPLRPWVVLAYLPEGDQILRSHIEEQERPDADTLWTRLKQTMSRPADRGGPRRPGIVELVDTGFSESLAPRLDSLGIRCVESDDDARIGGLYAEMAEVLAGPQRWRPLTTSPGATTGQFSAFFAAAADYYRSAPWRRLPGDSILRVDCPQFESGPWYAVVTGQSGLSLGIAVYDDLRQVRHLMGGGGTDESNARRSAGLSVMFGEEHETPTQDVDAARHLGWQIAGLEAFPSATRLDRGLALRVPLPWEIELLTGVLRAVPEFVEHLAAGTKPDAETRTTQVGRLTVTITGLRAD